MRLDLPLNSFNCKTKYHKLPTSTTNYHKLPPSTTNYHKVPQITTQNYTLN